jgi:hypothetical protein
VVTTIIGLIVAPATTGAVFAITLIIIQLVFSAGTSYPTRGTNNLAIILVSTVGGGIVGLAPALVVGLPMHHYLVRKQWNRALHYAALGAGVGALSIVVMVTIFQAWASGGGLPFLLPGFYMFLGMFAVSGAAGGLTFWIIRRPDRDAPPIPDEVFA